MRNCIQAVAAIVVLAAGGQALASERPSHASQSPRMTKARAKELMAKAAGHFTENKGQWKGDGRFVSRSQSTDVWVTRDGALFDFHRAKGHSRTGQVIRMRFAGAKGSLPATGETPDDGTFAYDHAKQKIVAHRFAQVSQHGAYPGVDVRYYLEAEHPRFDFVVAPNANPNQIGMRFKGASKVKIRPDAVVFGTVLGDIQATKLFAYQTDSHGRHRVAATFVARKDGAVGVAVGAYDRSRQLVIDPLVYGSYYGGEGGWDEVRSVIEDTDGGIYMVGDTQSIEFPALEGPYHFNLDGPQDGFVAKLEGDAYANIYSTFVGGSLSEYCAYTQLDQFGNLWVAGRTQSSDFPGNTRENIEYLQLGRDNLGNIGPSPNGGTFQLGYGNYETPPLPWNDSDADIEAQLNSLPGCTVDSITGTLPGTLKISLSNASPLQIQIVSNAQGRNTGLEPEYYSTYTPNQNTIIRTGSYPNEGTFTITFTNPYAPAGTAAATTLPIPYNASAAAVQTALNALADLSGGTFVVTGGPLPPPPGPSGQGGDPQMIIQFEPAAMAAPVGLPTQDLRFNSTGLGVYGGTGPAFPAVLFTPSYQIYVPTDIFVQRWARLSNGQLNPLPTTTLMFGGDKDETICGFAVQQQANPVAGSPVVFGFAGNLDDTLVENTVGPITGAYIARYSWTASTGFVKQSVKYLGDIVPGQTTPVAPLLIGGFAMDTNGNGYIAGEIEYNGNDTNPTDDYTFICTPGAFGTQLRFRDVFVRKYSPLNALIYSGILGGNSNDYIGGYDFDPDATIETTGSAIAVDANNCAYVTGITTSFDFPRTRNVVGPVFVADPNATCFATKISADGSTILYSTSLNTGTLEMYTGQPIAPHRIGIGLGGEWVSSPVLPAGIAVDATGNAFITGNGHPQWISFPDPPGMPGDPNEPTGQALPTIPLVNPIGPITTGSYTSIATPDYPTASGWLTVLNSTAQQFIISMWLSGTATDGGADVGEQVFAPYVNQFGDVWTVGSWTSGRAFERVSSTGTVTIFDDGSSSLPAELISPLAFKSVPDHGGGNSLNSMYGVYQHQEQYWGYTSNPLTVTMGYVKDGFVDKIRVIAPAIASVTFNPATIPGGFGASTTATVTLSAPAPVGGANVQVAITSNTAAATLASGGQVITEAVTIAAGQTATTFPVYSNPVLATTAVDIQCTYLGSFQIALLNVVPWLQGISVTPNTVVGGSVTSGLVSLETAAPAAGITVNLSSDHPSLISFPGGSNTVVVPAGQTTATFPIQTQGVSTQTFANVTGSLGGVNFSAPLTLTTAALLSLNFSPAVIPGLGTTVGTVTLNGQAGSNLSVSLSGLPAGFSYTVGNKTTVSTGPTTTVVLPFPVGATQATFTVTTPFEPGQVVETVTATQTASNGYAASSTSGKFTVSVATIKDITMTPNPVSGGSSTVGEVDLNQPAPTGGVVVNLSGNPAYVTFMNQTGASNLTNINAAAGTATLTIPAGSTSGLFVVGPTPVNGSKVTTEIFASRGTDTVGVNLTILAASIGLTFNNNAVVGGVNSGANQVTGTLTLSNVAGPGGVTVDLQAVLASGTGTIPLTVPSQVLIPAGQSSVTFTVTTSPVLTNTEVNVYYWPDTPSTPAGTHPATAQFQQVLVETPGVLSVSFSTPSGASATSVAGGSQVEVTVTLNSPAPQPSASNPNGGLTITLGVQNSQFTVVPASVPIAAGQASVQFTLLTRRVSRNQSTTLTASTPGSSASATLLVTIGF